MYMILFLIAFDTLSIDSLVICKVIHGLLLVVAAAAIIGTIRNEHFYLKF